MQPLVSILISAYNQEAFITEAVDSALRQSYGHREIIVVDDGSTDATRSRLQAYGDQILYIHQTNRGPSGARNTAIRHANGELLAFLDGDDVWEPEHLAAQVEACLAHPHTGLVATDACVFAGDTVLKVSDLDTKSFLDAPDGGTVTGRFYRQMVQRNFIASSSQVMIPARVLKDVGLCNERLRRAIDYDLYLRVASRYEMTFVKRVLTRWRYVPTSISGKAQTRHISWGYGSVLVLQAHLPLAPPEERTYVQQTLCARTLLTIRDAYSYGCDHHRVEAMRWLLRLWRERPMDLRPWMFIVGLWSPQLFRRLGGSLLRLLSGKAS